MGNNTKIEWCDTTWSPVTGCSKVSEGCAHCYAERMSKRLAGRFGYPVDEPFRVTFHPDQLTKPFTWKKPQMIFVCSMSDLFHSEVKRQWQANIFNTIVDCRQHTFIILTKRPRIMANFMKWWSHESIIPNLWLGTTVENNARRNRIDDLLQIPAAVHFVSAEPLLGPLDLSPWIDRLQWVIAGGETGPNARPMHSDWARKLRNDCQSANTPFFFKHFGEWGFTGDNATHALTSYGALYKITDSKADTNGHYLCSKIGKKYAGRILDGREWSEMPEEMPEVK